MATGTRERLLEAAERQFARHGLLATTLDEIRDDAEVSVGSLYHHFSGKEELHAAAWLTALADYRREILAELDRHARAEAGVRGIVRAHLRWLGRHREGATLLAGPRPTGAGAARADELTEATFARVRAWSRTHAVYGAVRDLDALTLYALWLGPAQEYGRLWLAGAVPAPDAATIEALADGAWQALRCGDGR